MRRTWITLIVTFVSLVIGGAIAVADDHGDSPLAATPLSVGGDPTSGCIETAGDADYFLFSAVAGRTYRLMTTHLSSGMDFSTCLIPMDAPSWL
jgi:hypothetical protein